MKGAALPLAVLGTTAVIATIVIVSKRKAASAVPVLPQLADAALHNKVIATIVSSNSAAELRQLAAGLLKQGGMAEAAAANIKAATLDKGVAAVTAAQALPTASSPATSVAQTITQAVSTAAASQPTLRQGSSGPPVLQWQGVLMASGISLTMDGQFGPETIAATKAWQSAHGLTADGVVGPQTWAKALSP
jgi:murein L,D-transpeptidase YcbB/YkuD